MKNIRIAIDIETVGVNPSAEEVDEYRASCKAPSNYKDPGKIAKNIEEQVEKWKSKRALQIGGAQIVACALCFCEDEQLNTIGIAGDDERSIIHWVAEELNDYGCKFDLVTWNGTSFDLPMLSVGFAKHGATLEHPVSKWSGVDLFANPFGKRGKLKTISRAFGIEQSFEAAGVTGSDVKKLYEKKDFEAIDAYCKDDTRITAELYKRVSKFYDV